MPRAMVWLAATALGIAVLCLSSRGFADDVRSGIVICTATRSHVIVANPNRMGGFLQNVGTLHVNVGRGSQMATLHVGAVYEMTPGYRGGLDCQTQGGTGGTAVEWLEELR